MILDILLVTGESDKMRKKILILGASGMLGIEVLREALKLNNFKIYATIRKKNDIQIIKKNLKTEINKITFNKFQINSNYAKNLKNLVNNKDIVINCIGVIKPYINENSFKSKLNAININSVFPHMLNSLVNKRTKIFQIATDCVFDGKDGDYNENFSHNAKDIYGKSKSLGEVKSKNFFNIRCSIIGLEIKNYKSLLSWFLNQKHKSNIKGFSNHLWNGITTSQFAKIVFIIIKKKIIIPNTIHIIPKRKINKYQLLKIFQKKFNRYDLNIRDFKSKLIVDRTLSTIYLSLNSKIFTFLGHKVRPSIKEMIDDMKY